ncbi:MAG: amidohydrolase [Oscillospiraceae bacterium]|nr:amidohydrolase [Oscillospiraceae bacterium]
MYLLGGILHTMTADPVEPGYVAFEGGTITAVGPMSALELPKGAQTLDVTGCHIYPGLVDAHCHLGVFDDGLTVEGADGNEGTDPVTPQLRGIDSVDPFDRGFQEAREGGVTTVVTGPGSANAIGGQLCALKTAGRRVDDMILRAPVAMKFALGENPKRFYRARSQAPTTRMGTAAIIREALFRARAYAEKKDRGEHPEFDMKLEALEPVVRGELTAHFHSHRADDICTAIRIAREFDLDYVIIHGTEGHRIADILAAEGARVVTGPVLGDRSKPELSHKEHSNTARLMEAGVLTAVCTDHPENPIQYLPLCAAMAAREGIAPEQAMASITRDAAVIAGIADRVGTLEPGKDADIAVFRGHPLEVASTVEAVFIDGNRVK